MTRPFKDPSGKASPIAIRLAPRTLRQLDELAEMWTMSRTDVIRRLIKEAHQPTVQPPNPARCNCGLITMHGGVADTLIDGVIHRRDHPCHTEAVPSYRPRPGSLLARAFENQGGTNPQVTGSFPQVTIPRGGVHTGPLIGDPTGASYNGEPLFRQEYDWIDPPRPTRAERIARAQQHQLEWQNRNSNMTFTQAEHVAANQELPVQRPILPIVQATLDRVRRTGTRPISSTVIDRDGNYVRIPPELIDQAIHDHDREDSMRQAMQRLIAPISHADLAASLGLAEPGTTAAAEDEPDFGAPDS